MDRTLVPVVIEGPNADNPWEPIDGENGDSATILATHQYRNHPDDTGDFSELAMRAMVKWDGCIDLTWYHATTYPETGWDAEDADSLHICDLDEFIANLTRLRDRARAYFAAHGQPEWPDF